MRLSHVDNRTGGEIHFIQNEKSFRQKVPRESKVFTIALNIGPDQKIVIDEVPFVFPSRSLLPLFANQSFDFESAEHIAAWQYNRDFYCIIDHDTEVSCAGFLFFGSFGNLFIHLDNAHWQKLDTLKKIFIEEFETSDSIQTGMLQMLLKRLIIITTRLGKEQYLKGPKDGTDRYEVLRKYNLLVEEHFKKEHKVQFYANLLNKSPKTLTNLFAQANQKTPSYIIHDRIISETKRYLYYSDKSIKEISYELGFEDAAHFSRFFKNFTKLNMTEFKKHKTGAL